MPLSIKNDETEELVRKLAEATGESLTEAIRVSIEERYERLKRARTGLTLGQELNEIALRCSRRPVVSAMTPDEILGYDDSGVPTR
jgi:antitoxin VapB